MQGISGKAANFGLPENKFKYNGIEFETDLNLIVYDAFFRELDPQTGKWWEIDPKWEKDMENWGAYVSNFSNPIRYKDPKGDCPKCDEVFKDVKSSIKETLVSAYDGAVSVARELNQFNPLANLYEVISGKSIASDFTQPKPRLMAVADMGVNTLMLFGPKVALGFSTETKVVNGGKVAASAENATAKEGTNLIEKAANSAKNWLGKDFKVVTNKAGDKVFISKDGLRKMRFDIKNAHGDKPHIHLEVFSKGKWRDAISDTHRIYPKQ